MSHLSVNYGAVQSKTSQIRNGVTSRRNDTTSQLSGVRSSVSTKDSASNACFANEVDSNRRKANSSARVFTKLTNFIHGSSEQIRLEQDRISSALFPQW